MLLLELRYVSLKRVDLVSVLLLEVRCLSGLLLRQSVHLVCLLPGLSRHCVSVLLVLPLELLDVLLLLRGKLLVELLNLVLQRLDLLN